MNNLIAHLLLMLTFIPFTAVATSDSGAAAVWNDEDKGIVYIAHKYIVKIKYVPASQLAPGHGYSDRLTIHFESVDLTGDQYTLLRNTYPNSALYPNTTIIQDADVEASDNLKINIPSIRVQESIQGKKGRGAAIFTDLSIAIPQYGTEALKAAFADPNDPVIHIGGSLHGDFPFQPRHEHFTLPGYTCSNLTDGAQTVQDTLLNFPRLSLITLDDLDIKFESTRLSLVQNFFAECFTYPSWAKSFSEFLSSPITAQTPESIVGETNYERPSTYFEFQYTVEKE